MYIQLHTYTTYQVTKQQQSFLNLLVLGFKINIFLKILNPEKTAGTHRGGDREKNSNNEDQEWKPGISWGVGARSTPLFPIPALPG